MDPAAALVADISCFAFDGSKGASSVIGTRLAPPPLAVVKDSLVSLEAATGVVIGFKEDRRRKSVLVVDVVEFDRARLLPTVTLFLIANG